MMDATSVPSAATLKARSDLYDKRALITNLGTPSASSSATTTSRAACWRTHVTRQPWIFPSSGTQPVLHPSYANADECSLRQLPSLRCHIGVGDRRLFHQVQYEALASLVAEVAVGAKTRDELDEGEANTPLAIDEEKRHA